MKITAKHNEYRSSKTGAPVFVYTVQGTPEELAAYKTAQGDNYRENEDGKPLFFSTRPIEAGSTLQVNSKGGYFVATNLEAQVIEADLAIEMAKNAFLGKLAAVGITPAQYKARMLADL